MTDTIMGQQAFQYDRLNRLVGDTIQGPAGNGALSWSYDPFGNRQSQSSTGQLSFPMTQMTATYQRNSLQNGVAQGVYSNRMDGVNHDLSGNVLGDPVAGQNFYSYDAGSRLQSAGSVCYVYNAEGMRTAKGNTLVNGACTNITAQYILGPGGEQVTELSGQANNPVWAHTNVFGGGKLLATYDNAGTHFHFTDWLGTMRAQVNADGTLEESCLSLPFGDALSCSGPGSDATEHHFTGKERDAESGLDYFGARYFQSNAGRWMSPDWAAKAEPIPYAKMGYPQTLNLYAYVENNPLSMADIDGHCGTAAPIPCGGESDRIADSDLAQEQMRERHQAANDQAERQKATPPAQQHIDATANVVYNETGGLTGDATELADGRAAEATVFDHHPKAFPKSEMKLTKAQQSKIAKDPHARAVMDASRAAAVQGIGRADIGNHAITYAYDPGSGREIPSVPWMGHALETEYFGPFVNSAGGGAVPIGVTTFIVIMQDMPFNRRIDPVK